RAQFFKENYRAALEDFNAIAQEFAESNWQKEAEYQVASCYWRLGEYNNAEKAYLDYISRYGGVAPQEEDVRNLIDVYRVLGENGKALSWLDKALTTRLSVASRQSLLFTKAKVFYIQARYTPALAILRQLALARLRPAPGNTTKDELRYYQAVTLSKL